MRREDREEGSTRTLLKLLWPIAVNVGKTVHGYMALPAPSTGLL